MASVLTIFVTWTLTLLAIGLGIFYIYVKSVYKYFEQRGVAYSKPTFPFGSTFEAIKNNKSLSCTYADIYRTYNNERLVGLFSFWKKQILIRDPELIKNVVVKDFDVFQDRGTYYNKEKDPLTAHLFALDGDTWKFLRSKLSPTFTSGKIKGMHENIMNAAKLVEKSVEKNNLTKKPLEVQSLFIKYGLEVISTTAFGLDSKSLGEEHNEFVRMARRVVEPTFIRFLGVLLMINGHVGRTLNVKLLPKQVSDFFLGVFKTAMNHRQVNNITRNDYLQTLIELKKYESQESTLILSEDMLAAQAFVFIVAGSDTTSSTMSFCLYELSRNPEVQARLHKELDSLPDLSYDNIQGCQYLDMVVSETLRKHPPLGFLNRVSLRDYKVPDSDVVIEKGTLVLISLQGLQNDPDLYPEPEVFNPERFSKENKDNNPSYTYMPFGDGPRYCIGKRFAKVVVKTGLATVLQRYQVLPSSMESRSLKMEPRSFITFVAGGMWLQLKERTTN